MNDQTTDLDISGDGATSPETALSARPGQSPASQMIRAATPQSQDDMMRLAQVFYDSGFFRDVKSAAQAFVKMQAGAELGLAPMEAQRSVHAFDGQTTLHYTTVLALIRKHPTYDYQILESTHDKAEILFYRYTRGEWQEEGTETWTVKDARKAGLMHKDNWKKYTRAMLLGRAATEGQRKFCPDVGGGPLYTPEELGGDVDSDGRLSAPPQRKTKTQAAGSQPAGSQTSAEPDPAGAMPGDVSTMKDMLDRVLRYRPGWYIEHIIGRRIQTWSEMTSDQVSATIEALDLASEVASKHDIKDVLSWLNQSEKNGYDLTDLASLEDAAQEWQKSQQDTGQDAGAPIQEAPTERPPEWYEAKIRACKDRFEARGKDQYRDITISMADFVSDWPDEWVKQVRYMMLPYRTVAEIRDLWGEDGAVESVKDWIDEHTVGWPEAKVQAARDALASEVKHLREHDLPSAVDAIASGEVALTPKQKDTDGEQADAFESEKPEHQDPA